MLEVDRRNLKEAAMPFLVNDIPLCIQGLTATGKTAFARNEAVAELERELRMECRYHDLRVSGMLPEDFSGIPHVYTNEQGQKITSWARPAFNPVDDGKLHFLNFEEITHNRAVFAPLYRVFSEREDAAGNKLPKNHRLMATCNTKEDRGGDSAMFKPLERRLAWILVRSTNIDTVQYGLDNGWDARLLGFLRKFPELNHKMNEEDPAWPNPARWEDVNKFMHLPIKRIEEIASAIIGKGVAMKFGAELEAMNVGIPRIADVVANPTGASVPNDDQHQYVIARLLSKVLSEANIDNIIIYLKRLTPDIASRMANDVKIAPNASYAVVKKLQELVM